MEGQVVKRFTPQPQKGPPPNRELFPRYAAGKTRSLNTAAQKAAHMEQMIRQAQYDMRFLRQKYPSLAPQMDEIVQGLENLKEPVQELRNFIANLR